MPLYDYVCAACGRRFEVIHGLHDEGPTSCPLCGKGTVRKAFAAPAIHFKGSGWAKKERRAGKVGTKASSGGDDGEGATSGGKDDKDGTSGKSGSSGEKGTSSSTGSGASTGSTSGSSSGGD